MIVEKGMKCRFIDPFGIECKGEVLSVDGDTFTVYEPLNCPPQYNDSIVDYTVSAIGTKVWFD